MDKKQVAIYVGLVVIGAAAGHFGSPAKVQIKEMEHIVYQDRVVQVQNQAVHTDTKETKLPNGTVVTETVQDTHTDTHTDDTKQLDDKSTMTETKSNAPDWSVGVYTNERFIAGTVDRRILGPIFVGVYGKTELSDSPNPEFGIGLRLEF